ncbi:MAG: helix-turn-helix transcriptional regulator [Vicinamibacteria bacterium]|nr:helix-turn-helix transcriptional regulator [Vicinamibacteria bacterium]
MSHDDLDHVWRALANPHRRRILDVLRDKPCTTGELAEAVGENRFLVMQHLNLLREADLVTVEVDGRRRINHLNPVPIQHIYERWVGKYQGDWAAALVGLKRTVEAKAKKSESLRRKRA